MAIPITREDVDLQTASSTSLEIHEGFNLFRVPGIHTLNPSKLNNNKDCLFCGQCIKSCKLKNMRLLLRQPFPTSNGCEALSAELIALAFLAIIKGWIHR